jgi:hypothetical protein
MVVCDCSWHRACSPNHSILLTVPTKLPPFTRGPLLLPQDLLPALCAEVACRLQDLESDAAREFSSQDLSNFVWALATLEHDPGEFKAPERGPNRTQAANNPAACHRKTRWSLGWTHSNPAAVHLALQCVQCRLRMQSRSMSSACMLCRRRHAVLLRRGASETCQGMRTPAHRQQR